MKKIRYSHAEQKKIQSLINETIKQEDDEIKAHLSRYIIIRISGYLEQEIQNRFIHLASTKCAPFILSYVQRNISRWNNANTDKIIELSSSFDKKWGSELDKFFDSEIKDKINSLIALRNKIAHGEDTGVTPNRSRELFEAVELVIEKIEKVISC